MLSYIKIGQKEFYLKVGDKFTSNMEGNIYYYPSTIENQVKLPFRNWSRDKYINLPKRLHREFLAAKNIEETYFKDGHKPEFRYIEWKVTSVEDLVIDKPDWGDLYYVGIKNFDKAKDDLFTIEKAKIEKIQNKQLILSGDGLCYRKKILKSEIGKVVSRCNFHNNICKYEDMYCVICYFEDFDVFRDKLQMVASKAIESQLKKMAEDFNKLNGKFSEEGFRSKKAELKIKSWN